MPTVQFEIRSGAYYDSVVLMQLQRRLADLPGVLDAGVVMGTPANCDLLRASDLFPAGAEAVKADDLLLVIKAEEPSIAKDALAQVDTLLQQGRGGAGQAFRPRSLESAAKQLPQASWVLISVPGRYAAGVAREALRLGKHIFLYSDNVSLEDEVALKQEAAAKGLLLMGPDCGTAIINGVGLGFANRVRRGRVGLVGASGTGLQAITAAVHNLGSGISQAIGTGGRDLHGEVGAVTATQGLELLARDPQTEVIVLVSKPPAPEVATRLLSQAQGCGKPVVVYFIGYPAPGRQLGNLHFAASLTEAAELAVNLPATTESKQAGQTKAPYLRALFSGGTLAYEALLGLQTFLYPLYSNVPVRPEQRLQSPLQSQAHTVLDLGEDEFTQGRLHPMMDNDLRLRRLRQEAADPEVGLLLLDVVLGEGAHPDPAGELAPAIAAVKAERELDVVALVVGTDEDPQDRPAQIEKLEAAGAVVFTDTTSALNYVNEKLARAPQNDFPPVALDAFHAPFAAINVGLESFYDSLQAQGGEVVQVEWRPPAGGNERLAALLARMKQG